MYCSGSGSSRWYLCRIAARTAGSRFSAPSAIAGSPGMARAPTKTSMLASTSTMRAAPTFLRRKPPIVRCLLVGRERDARQGVRVDLDALETRRDADSRDGVIQVDEGPVGEDELLRRAVERLARSVGRRLPGVVEDEIEPGIRVPAVVLRPDRVHELVDVAVRVDAARPA